MLIQTYGKNRLCWFWSQAASYKNGNQLLCLEPGIMICTWEVSFVVKENIRFCTVWIFLHVSDQPACYSRVLAVESQCWAATQYQWHRALQWRVPPMSDLSEGDILHQYSHSNDVWKQGKEAWPLFVYLYFWFIHLSFWSLWRLLASKQCQL